jgi:hypothetical protein
MNHRIRDLALDPLPLSPRQSPISSPYLGVEPIVAYRHLLSRLGLCLLTHAPLCSWLLGGRERQKTLLNVLQALVESLLVSNPSLKGDMRAIAHLSLDPEERDALFLTHLEAYCCQSIGVRPRLLFLLRDFLSEQPHISATAEDLLAILSR